MPVKRIGGDRARITAAVKGLGSQEGQVGWFESARYEDGKPVAGVAYVQEHGSTSRSIPPRPFFRPTVAERQQEWAKTTADAARGVLGGHIKPGDMTEALCLAAEGDVRKTISKITSPPLSALTLLARKERKTANKRLKKASQYGPQQPYRMSGRELGRLAGKLKDGPPDVSGVSTKPLVDSGLLLATLTSQVNGK